MKKIAALLSGAILAISCTSPDAGSVAVRYVRKAYPDVREIIYCKIDTVTYGDNLDWRIRQARQALEDKQSHLQLTRTLSHLPGQMDEIEKTRQEIIYAEEWVTALDSLRVASGELLDHTVAYLICVAYNVPANFVWVQLDEFLNLLRISKRREDMYFNPGDDIPGYFELYNKHYNE